MLILRPRASRIAPSEADAMPLPSEETTPPVTKTNRVIGTAAKFNRVKEQHATAIDREFEIRREFRLPDRTACHNRAAQQLRRTRIRRSGSRQRPTPGPAQRLTQGPA